MFYLRISTPSSIIRNLNSLKFSFGILTTRCGVSLDIAFNSKSLRTICEDGNEAVVVLGQPVSEFLKHRLADFRAAMNINDVLVGNPRVCENALQDWKEMIVDLHDGYKIVFRANHPQNPLDEKGRVDWIKVRRIKILRIEGANSEYRI